MNVHSDIDAAPERSRPGRPRKTGARQRILDAALKSFAARGYDGTAVPEVARLARTGVGTLYLHFANKEALVNEVFRDAKARLGSALLDGLETRRPSRAVFSNLWRRLTQFAQEDPLTFRFIEMQDHSPYLDAASRALELGVLHPFAELALGFSQGRATQLLPPDVLIAFIWGAAVGLFKAERLGYIRLTPEILSCAEAACWAIISSRARRLERRKHRRRR
jgi:AcrR family transcriptional regulator